MSASSITISTIAGDDILNAGEAASDLPISGTTTNVADGQTVTVMFNSGTFTTTVASNAWTLDIPAADLAPAVLPDGPHTVSADVTDPANGSANMTRTLTVDETPPAVTAALTTDTGASSTDGVTRDDALNGTGDANATVTLTEGGVTLGTTTADNTGAWSFTPSNLADGSHTITASETDAAGNTGTTSVTFTFDTTAPVAPSALVLSAASDSGASNSDDITNVPLPTFTGVGEDGATVTLLDGSTTIGTGTVSGGAWSVSATTALTEGANNITATQTDAAGNTSLASSVLNVTLDTIPPAVTAALTTDTGVSSTDGVTRDDALNGAGDANATVTLTEGGVTLGTTTADNTGVWSFTPSNLADGSHTITASETDAAGNTGTTSVTFTVLGSSRHHRIEARRRGLAYHMWHVEFICNQRLGREARGVIRSHHRPGRAHAPSPRGHGAHRRGVEALRSGFSPAEHKAKGSRCGALRVLRQR
ncbi:Ig-like domain-containing protein [Rhodopila sp.]|uniref:Ig-like domain-containing protein n=1 Tax=Rhodopila sp. TaxID=2480087 RepID=UPI003D10CBC2